MTFVVAAALGRGGLRSSSSCAAPRRVRGASTPCTTSTSSQRVHTAKSGIDSKKALDDLKAQLVKTGGAY